MVTKQEREISVIRHILSYCNLVSERLKQYNMSYAELVVKLSFFERLGEKNKFRRN